MKNQFHAYYEQDGDWFIAFCPEIPGANGMGKTKAECRENLLEAIDLILKEEDKYNIKQDCYVILNKENLQLMKDFKCKL